MKFRKLKKKKFKICFDWFQTDTDDPHVIVSYDGNKLSATYEWEYENGLYTETGYDNLPITWKAIKYNLSHYTKRRQEKNKMPYYVYIYNGKCCDCGKQVDFNKDFEDYMGWRCEECFDKLYDDWNNKWMDEWNNELEEYSEEAE